MTLISTHDALTAAPYLKAIHQPQSTSHKGQNGKVLVIGGSSLFHGAVLWAAEAASHIVDMVHVASTVENNEIIQKIKVMWQTGIVVSQKDILYYAEEDKVILVGNGMMRSEKAESLKLKAESRKWEDVLKIKDEGLFTREIVYYLIAHFPNKQFVLDAGALQVMDKEWLSLLRKKAIITPHQKEFQSLFGIDVAALSFEEKEKIVQQTAQQHSCIIILKAVEDIISDGNRVVRVQGGNAGLTKGGTGDILAGLIAGMAATSDPFAAAVVASFLLKQTAEHLFEIKGFWYTAQDIVTTFPGVFHRLNQPD